MNTCTHETVKIYDGVHRCMLCFQRFVALTDIEVACEQVEAEERQPVEKTIKGV